MRIWTNTLLNIALLLIGMTASTASSGVTLTGKVVDSTGKPLEDATVLVYLAGVKTGYGTCGPGCYADCGKRVVTDAAGAFIIKNLSPDLWFTLLVVRHGYYSELVQSVDPLKGAAPSAVLKTRQPVNDPQRVVRGRIVDSRGRPIRDPLVTPKGISFTDEKLGHVASFGTIAGLDRIAATNKLGEFEILYDRPALKVLLLVEARGFAPKLFNQLPTGLERHVLTVTDGATLRGRLVEEGKPVAGAQIGLNGPNSAIDHELNLSGNPYDEMRIGTQEDGTFAFTNVPAPVEWYVYGKMESIANRGATVPTKCATKTDGEDANVGDIRIQPGYRLRGNVVLSDGKSIADGMCVRISSDLSFDTQTVPLRTDGSFEFVGLAPGKYHVIASVKGYRSRQWEDGLKPDPPGTVRIERDTNDFVLTLDPAK